MVALFIIITVLAFLLIDLAVQRAARRKEALAPAGARPQVADRFLVPRGYFLSRGHSWIELLFTGNARIGIDDFVQKLIGPIDSITAVPAQSEIRKGEPLFTLRCKDRTLSIPSPLSGKVIEANPVLADHPSTVNTDPYLAGWGVVLEPTKLAAELPLLTIADSAAAWLKGEVSRFRNFIKEYAFRLDAEPLPAGVTLLDGGMPVAGVLQITDSGTWKAFEREFLCNAK